MSKKLSDRSHKIFKNMKKFTSYARGFTLIELLVVIAIIGILASVVLVSLGSARAKGSDAKIQEQMSAIRNAAELFATSNSGSYTGMCASTELASLMTPANWPNTGVPACLGANNGGKWAAYHILVSTTTQAVCVDSTGMLKTVPATQGGYSSAALITPGTITLMCDGATTVN